MGGDIGRTVTGDELEHAATRVLAYKIWVQNGLLVLYGFGFLSWTFMIIAAVGNDTPIMTLKSTEGIGLLILLLFGTVVLFIRGLGRSMELQHNRQLLLEYWMHGTRITEHHDAWHRYKQLSAVDKLDPKLG